MRRRRSAADPARRRLISDLLAFAFVAALLIGVGFLPTDTTLQQVRSDGVLRVCFPEAFPPLVTGSAELPGIDVEIMEAVAADLGVRLLRVTNTAIGRDFNPRNWRVTRAQCLVLAGGVVDSTITRSFLVLTPPHLATGWAAVPNSPDLTSLEGAQVGFYAGLTGLDRLALSAWLRARGARVSVLQSEEAAREGLAAGTFDAVVSEALTAARVADATGREAVWIAPEGERLPIAFGLWKGDLTLERAIERSLRRLERDGSIDRLIERYRAPELNDTCLFCG